MAAEFTWLDDATILIAVFRGRLTGEDLLVGMDYLIDHLDKADHPIHNISDYTQVTRYPFVGEFMQRSLVMLNHKNMGWITIVGGNAIMRIWIQLFQKIAPLRVAHFATVDEALQFIREQNVKSNASI